MCGQKEAVAVGQACDIWLGRIESNSANTDVDQQRRRGKHGKAKNSAGLFRKGESSDIVKCDLQCAASTAKLIGLVTKNVREAIHEIIYMHWRVAVLVNMVQTGQVIQRMLLVPTGSNREIEVTLLPRDERVVTQEESVWLDAGLTRSSSDSTESRITLGEHAVCDGPQDDIGSVQEQDQTFQERVACNVPQEDVDVVVQMSKRVKTKERRYWD